MSSLRSKRSRFVTLVALIVVASLTMLLSLEACAWQGKSSELKISDLLGYPILRIDDVGSVFDTIESKVAVINDREGTFTLTKDHQKVAFKNDPAIKRDNDRYIVKLGDGAIFEVKPDGGILLNGKLWGRVIGYTQNDAQKNRFMAAIVILGFLGLNIDAPDDVSLMLQRDVKNAERDPAIRKESIVWIPSDDEVYADDERIPKADFDSRLADRVDEFLKRRKEPNKTVYLAASFPTEYGTVVRVIDAIRASKQHVQQVGLIVEGHSPWDRFLLQIPALRDPNEDVSKLQPSTLPLGVVLSTDLQLKLIRGGIVDAFGHHPIGAKPYGNSEEKGTVDDTSNLSGTLTRIFQERKEQHVYKSGMETRSDVPEDERVEKTVVIKAYRYCPYGDVIKLIDAVKGAGANPIIMYLDDLP